MADNQQDEPMPKEEAEKLWAALAAAGTDEQPPYMEAWDIADALDVLAVRAPDELRPWVKEAYDALTGNVPMQRHAITSHLNMWASVVTNAADSGSRPRRDVLEDVDALVESARSWEFEDLEKRGRELAATLRDWPGGLDEGE